MPQPTASPRAPLSSALRRIIGGYQHLKGPLCLILRIYVVYSVKYSPLQKPLVPGSTHYVCCVVSFGLVCFHHDATALVGQDILIIEDS
jgi:hypothetical protein